jgi:phage terminase large subunit
MQVNKDKKSAIRVNKKFAPLWQLGKTRYYLVYGGRGSGKSFATQLALAYRMFMKNQVIANTRYVLANAEDSVIPEFLEKLELITPDYEKVFEWQHAKNEVINKLNKSKMIFRGFKTSTGLNTAKIKSLKGLNIWLMEEAEELTEDIFDTMDFSIRAKDTDNAIILVFNPTTKAHWLYRRFFEEQGVPDTFQGRKNNTTYIFTTYLDNKENLNKSFLERIEKLKQTNYAKYKHKLLGFWLDKVEGLIFDNWEISEFVDSKTHLFGLDFGVLDPDALVKVSIFSKYKVIYVKELFYKSNNSTDELAKELGRLVKKRDLIIADSASPRTIKDLRARGFNIRPTKKFQGSVLYGIRLLKDYRIFVDPASTNLIKELNSYAWLDRKGEIPVDENNHLIDALRYAVMYYHERKASLNNQNKDLNIMF